MDKIFWIELGQELLAYFIHDHSASSLILSAGIGLMIWSAVKSKSPWLWAIVGGAIIFLSISLIERFN